MCTIDFYCSALMLLIGQPEFSDKDEIY